ncbi:MAG: LytTR family DNA-binding domain-containing protein [Oceanicaulis sp.]
MTPPIEHRAARKAWALYAALAGAFWIVNSFSAHTDWTRTGYPGSLVEAFVLEGVSTLFIVLLFPAVAWLERRVPPRLDAWTAALPAHLIGSVAFSLAHVGLMMGLRALLWPVLFSKPYEAFDAPLTDALYEYRKDLLSYAIMLVTLALSREREEALAAAAAAGRAARADRMVVLKSGGREIRLPAGEIVAASAQGNYAEVRTASGAHLARITLSGLETLMAEAGADPVRLHRSHLAARGHLREIVPTGGGEAEARLSDGSVLPVSRRYRSGL